MSAEIIRWVLENLDYWVVVLFMAIESSFIPFPSEVVVPPAAWLSMASDSMNIVLVVVAATIGADVGALVNYALARYLGRPIVYRFADSRLGHLCLLDRAKVEHAEDYFRRHGATSTFFGRLVPAVRQLISIPAGLAKMPIGKFLVFTTLGAGVWNTILALIGWGIYRFTSVKTVDEVYQLAKQYNAEISIAVLVIVAIAIGVVVYKARKK
ncbi:MAG: DedA family protein [Bacteroidaceae bacterium]|nr:DedA family protein [Bacteroidaceae bacterium]MBR6927350.1 DedA family protein [Bacteroidaceae bacterium]MBR7029223.1 DedA family protein [Bacteroidaceae bacterium]